MPAFLRLAGHLVVYPPPTAETILQVGCSLEIESSPPLLHLRPPSRVRDCSDATVPSAWMRPPRHVPLLAIFRQVEPMTVLFGLFVSFYSLFWIHVMNISLPATSTISPTGRLDMYTLYTYIYLFHIKEGFMARCPPSNDLQIQGAIFLVAGRKEFFSGTCFPRSIGAEGRRRLTPMKISSRSDICPRRLLITSSKRLRSSPSVAVLFSSSCSHIRR